MRIIKSPLFSWKKKVFLGVKFFCMFPKKGKKSFSPRRSRSRPKIVFVICLLIVKCVGNSCESAAQASAFPFEIITLRKPPAKTMEKILPHALLYIETPRPILREKKGSMLNSKHCKIILGARSRRLNQLQMNHFPSPPPSVCKEEGINHKILSRKRDSISRKIFFWRGCLSLSTRTYIFFCRTYWQADKIIVWSLKKSLSVL